MLKNYFKIAFRNLSRQKLYSAINLIGLSAGMTCCIFIFLYVQDELGYDSFNKNYNNIYRIIETQKNADGSVTKVSATSWLAGAAAKEQLPFVKDYTRIIGSNFGRFSIKYKDKNFYSGNHIFADPGLFRIFDFELLKGSYETSIRDVNSVVLTESAADKYFGNENPMGKFLNVERLGECKVTGILKDLPQNSHIQFDMIFSSSSLNKFTGFEKFINSWKSEGIITYLLIKPGYDKNIIEKSIQEISRQNFTAEDKKSRTIFIQQLKDIHFNSNDIEFDYLNVNKKDKIYIYVLSSIALFIILIACINYTNLSIAKSFFRSKEIGLRKVLGADRKNVVKQFLGESLILSFLSLIAALIFVELLLPLFNSISGKEINASYLENLPLLVLLILLTVIIGLVSGGYPAFYLSKFNPVRVLKGGIKDRKTKSTFMNSLVVTQYALSVVMIISAIAAIKQLDYLKNKNLGFNKEHTVIIDINSGNTRKNFNEIKNEISKYPAVKNVSVSSRIPGDWKEFAQIEVNPDNGHNSIYKSYFIAIDKDFLETFKINLIEGRNFSHLKGADSSSVLINTTAAKLFGWNDPVGKKIKVPGSKYEATIIGMVEDFNYQSLYDKVAPLVLGYWYNPIQAIDYFSVKINPANISGTLSYLKSVHETFDKVTPFEYNFLDERISDFYREDERMSSLFIIAAIISIVIACLGLFALVSYISLTRTKEIGVRKVLGANTINILSLLSKEFVTLILIANLIAFPIAYFFTKDWLNEFAYKINIGIEIFFTAFIISVLLAVITILYQVIKAASANPVKSLKYE